MRFSETLRNAQANAIESTVGTAPKLRIFSGAEPGSVSDADPSGMLIEMTLPSDWMAAASGGSVDHIGPWTGTVTADGTALCWRIYTSGGTCHIQGNMDDELVLDSDEFISGQTLTITSFTFIAGIS